MRETIFIAGAGRIGLGAAQLFAAGGHDVALFDCAGAAELLEAYLRKLASLLDRGRVAGADVCAVRDRVRAVETLRAAGSAHLVLEAVSESEAEKGRLFQELDALCGPDTIFASATASLSITRLGCLSGRPERFLGMQFFAPVPLIDLAELTPAPATSRQTLRRCRELLAQLGRTYIVSRDTPGFTVNRQIIPSWNEAFYLMEEGVAPQDIDAAMRLATEAPLGPLQLADYVGLDLVLSVMEALYRGGEDGKYAPCPKLRELVAAGRLGRKSGEGVYRYE